jgi:hypothetical protein
MANLLVEFAYFMFNKDGKSISQDELQEFLRQYENDYVFDEKTFDNLVTSSILIDKNNTYSFQYVYIYYYFVVTSGLCPLGATVIVPKFFTDLLIKSVSSLLRVASVKLMKRLLTILLLQVF